MPQLTAALLALAALSGSILSGQEPMRCLASGAAAGAIGWVLGSLWRGLTKLALRRQAEPEASEGEAPDEPEALPENKGEQAEDKERKAA